MFDASEQEYSLNDLIRYVHDLEYGATARNSIHTNWILLVSQQWNKDLKTRCECGLENKLTQRYDMHFTHIFDAKMFYALVHFWVHNIICLSYCHSFQMPSYKRKMILLQQAVPIVQFFNVVQISDDVLYMMIMSSSNCHIVNKDIISSCGPFLHFIFFSLVYKSHVSQQPVFLAAFEPFREDMVKANNPKNSTLDKSLCLK